MFILVSQDSQNQRRSTWLHLQSSSLGSPLKKRCVHSSELFEPQVCSSNDTVQVVVNLKEVSHSISGLWPCHLCYTIPYQHHCGSSPSSCECSSCTWQSGPAQDKHYRWRSFTGGQLGTVLFWHLANSTKLGNQEFKYIGGPCQSCMTETDGPASSDPPGPTHHATTVAPSTFHSSSFHKAFGAWLWSRPLPYMHEWWGNWNTMVWQVTHEYIAKQWKEHIK